jgi:ribosomal protein L29
MRKANEFRTLDNEQLQQEVNLLQRRILELRSHAQMSKLERPHEIKEARREIACILTLLIERERGINTTTTDSVVQ